MSPSFSDAAVPASASVTASAIAVPAPPVVNRAPSNPVGHEGVGVAAVDQRLRQRWIAAKSVEAVPKF